MSLSATAAYAALTPKLPSEISRIAGVVTPSGKKLYDNIEVDIGGDRARIFVPQALSVNSSARVGAVWFHHASGSDHNAMNGGFKYPAELVVDQATIAICINAGGTQYTNAYAQQAQKNAWAYLTSLFAVRMNFLRATSGGGALATYTYANKLIPYIRGLYMVNAAYDLESIESQSPARWGSVVGVYGNDKEVLVANNPSRIPAEAWAGSNVKVVVSDAAHPDLVVDPDANGLALINRVTGVAADAQLAYHTLGHNTPSFTNKDMITTFGKWSGTRA